MEDKIPSKLFKTLSEATNIVRSHDFIQVFSHYDADGVSSASIIAKTLLRSGKEFRITLFSTLNDHNMDIIRNNSARCIFVTDMGASYIDQLDKMDCDIVVLDHHTIISEATRICYANPHLYGIDGMTSGCGATLSFLFSIVMDDSNWDLVQIAFAGIAGDRQHINGISGLNMYLLHEGMERGFIERTPGSIIPDGDITTELFLTTDPYIRGISGNMDGVKCIMKDANIQPGKMFMELSEYEKRKLSSLITIKLIQQGMQTSSINEVARDRYHLKKMNVDAEYLSSILNVCGRSGFGGVGVAIGMGDIDCMTIGSELRKKYARQIVENMVNIDKKGLIQLDSIQYFDSTSSGFTGMLCGIAMQSIGNPNKPTIGLNKSRDPINISSRGMLCQLDMGIDLSVAMRKACTYVGGNGGGHRIASGGSIPADKSEEFISKINEIVKDQINKFQITDT